MLCRAAVVFLCRGSFRPLALVVTVPWICGLECVDPVLLSCYKIGCIGYRFNDQPSKRRFAVFVPRPLQETIAVRFISEVIRWFFHLMPTLIALPTYTRPLARWVIV